MNAPDDETPPEHLDVLIVGAGLSGIGAACHLQANVPRQVASPILEAREAIGGTWDLFRYPGIRSDSDMFTLGYSFRPGSEAEGDRRRAVDPRLHPRDRARVRRSSERIRFRPSRRRRRMVDRRRRAGRVEVERTDTGEIDAPDLRLPVHAAPATTATTRATRRSSRAASASRAGSSTRSTGPRTSTTPASASS